MFEYFNRCLSVRRGKDGKTREKERKIARARERERENERENK